MSGVDSFVWTYSKEADASGVNVTEKSAVIGRDQITYSEDGKQAKGNVPVKQHRNMSNIDGSIAVKANDRAGNSSVKNDNARIEIIDTISPTRSVSYTAAKQVWMPTHCRQRRNTSTMRKIQTQSCIMMAM